MLDFSVLHPSPKGGTYQVSSHLTEKCALLKIKTLESLHRNHPERFDKAFDPSKLTIRDNRDFFRKQLEERMKRK